MIHHVVFLCALSVSLVGFQVKSENSESEVDGKWELVTFNENGKESEDTVTEKFIITRKSGLQTIQKDGKDVSKSRFAVDTKSDPKTITFKDVEKDEISTVGIYMIEKDSMKVAILSDKEKNAKERPKNFDPASGKTVATYRKTK